MRVRSDMPPGHVRTPTYLRGKTGQIERFVGGFPNPEQRAYGHDPDQADLYRVRFRMADLWGAETEGSDDTLDAEIYAHWLMPVPG